MYKDIRQNEHLLDVTLNAFVDNKKLNELQTCKELNDFDMYTEFQGLKNELSGVDIKNIKSYETLPEVSTVSYQDTETGEWTQEFTETTHTFKSDGRDSIITFVTCVENSTRKFASFNIEFNTGK